MYLFHNIGKRINSNYNLLSEVLACAAQGPISFDGVYRNVYENRECLKGLDVTMFIMGDYVGKDNSFDTGQPYEKLCSWDELIDLHMNYGFKFGWHSWSHRNLTLLSNEEVLKECTPPFPMDYFAYPYGDVDDRVADIVLALDYKDAWSVTQGTGIRFQRNRKYFGW